MFRTRADHVLPPKVTSVPDWYSVLPLHAPEAVPSRSVLPPFPAVNRKANRSPPPRRSTVAPAAVVTAFPAMVMRFSTSPPEVMLTPRGSIQEFPSALRPKGMSISLPSALRAATEVMLPFCSVTCAVTGTAAVEPATRFRGASTAGVEVS